MVAQSINVRPLALVQAAASAAATAETAATPHPGVVPVAVPGSAADLAAVRIAAGLGVQSVQLSAKVAGWGPQVQAATQRGLAQLRGQDAQNGVAIGRLGDGLRAALPTLHGSERWA